MRHINSAQLIEATGAALRNEFEECKELIEFNNSLSALCSAGGKHDPSSVFSSITTILWRMKEIIAVVKDNPNTIAAPEPCQLPGETTIRARFGLRAAAEFFSNDIVEKLEAVSLECDSMWSSVKLLQASCEEILKVLRTCSEGVSHKCVALASLDKVIESAFLPGHTDKRGFVDDSLDVIYVQKCLVKLAALPRDLRQLSATASREVEKIQDFSRRAPDDVRKIFVLPFPASVMQSVLVGEDPPTKRRLLAKLYALGSLDLRQIVTRLENLRDGIADLQIKIAEKSLLKFTAASSERLKALEQDMKMLSQDCTKQVPTDEIKKDIGQSKQMSSVADIHVTIGDIDGGPEFNDTVPSERQVSESENEVPPASQEGELTRVDGNSKEGLGQAREQFCEQPSEYECVQAQLSNDARAETSTGASSGDLEAERQAEFGGHRSVINEDIGADPLVIGESSEIDGSQNENRAVSCHGQACDQPSKSVVIDACIGENPCDAQPRAIISIDAVNNSDSGQGDKSAFDGEHEKADSRVMIIEDQSFAVGDICELIAAVQVRAEEGFDSTPLKGLFAGNELKIVEVGQIHRRIKIRAGRVTGWISAKTEAGVMTIAKKDQNFMVGDYCEVKNNVRVRAEEDLQSMPIGGLTRGTELEIIQVGQIPRRVKIKTEDMTGWISVTTEAGVMTIVKKQDLMTIVKDVGVEEQVLRDACAETSTCVGNGL